MRSVRVALLVAASLMGACTPREAAAPVQPTHRGEIVVGVAEIGELDPAKASATGGLRIIAVACDGLLALDPADGTPGPALAIGWEMRPDARSFVLRLRPKVAFQDGTQVTAPEIAESMSRLARPDTASPWAHLVSIIEGYEDVAGGAASHLSGLKVLSGDSLQIDTSSPYPDLPSLLAHPALIPVMIDGEVPVCAGPYRITKEGEDAVLTAEGGSRSRSDVYLRSGRGFISKIIFRTIQPGGWPASEADMPQMAEVVDGIDIPGDAVVMRSVSNEISYLEMTGDPFTDVRIRRSISLAIDRLVVTDAAFGEDRTPALGWRSGSEEQRACPGVGRIADTEEAKRLWGEAGIDPATVNTQIHFRAGDGDERVVKALALQLSANLGINVEPHPLEPDAFAAFREQGPGGLWYLPRQRTAPLDDQALTGLVHGEGEATAAIEEARATVAPRARADAYNQAERAVCEQMDKVPLWAKVDRWWYLPAKVGFRSDVTMDHYGFPLLRNAYAL